MSEWKSKASLENPDWKYTPTAATDVSKTIARVRREMKELAEKQAQDSAKKITSLKVREAK